MIKMSIRPQKCDAESIELELVAYVDGSAVCVRVAPNVARISPSAMLTEFAYLLPRMNLRRCCTSELAILRQLTTGFLWCFSC